MRKRKTTGYLLLIPQVIVGIYVLYWFFTYYGVGVNYGYFINETIEQFQENWILAIRDIYIKGITIIIYFLLVPIIGWGLVLYGCLRAIIYGLCTAFEYKLTGNKVLLVLNIIVNIIILAPDITFFLTTCTI